MALLIKNVTVFAPESLGVKDLLVVDAKLVAIESNLTVTMPGLEVLDGTGLTLTPGLIDHHIHVIGGGGEGGPKSRTPELMLSELIKCGTTSLVGVLGTDSVTRSPEALLAKVRALNTEGVSAWMMTSNYALPQSLLTDSVRKDLFCVPEVIGVKIAMFDHRCSFPTLDEIMRIVSDVRVGGMIAGKTGFLHIHLGELPGAYDTFDEIVRRGVPIRHLKPTHCARTPALFDQAIAFGKKGGLIDITSGGGCYTTPAKALIYALEAGVNPGNIAFSSDGHGSIPRFNADGVMVGLGTGEVASNIQEFKSLVELGLSLDKALPCVTKNPATHFGLEGKGEVKAGNCADFCLFDSNLNLKHVMAKGRLLMRDGEVVVKGTFEE